MNPDNNQAVFKYLQDMSKTYQLAIPLLQIIIEQRKTAHHERWNKGKQQQNFKVCDVVKSHIQAQLKAETGEIKKLSYQERGKFQIETV